MKVGDTVRTCGCGHVPETEYCPNICTILTIRDSGYCTLDIPRHCMNGKREECRKPLLKLELYPQHI